ncbi:MAG: hypothetical protein CL927_04625 [Deltaproteobacteria bacterium]|nr:hypothetical protein [Deltaproteobacteria bacterium]HCH63086.1 hypothetical protein [Deltaproteobacteria bacterium]
MSGVTTASLLGLLWAAQQAPSTVQPFTPSAVTSQGIDDLALSLLEADTHTLLDAISVDAVVTSRVKTPDSLVAKAIRKGIQPDAVLDRLALRVRVDSVQDCYRVMSSLQDRFTVVTDSADDYIAQPKANGYQSLHAALHTHMGIAEFQVRTHEMHHHAERGTASHAVYKATQATTV